MQQVQGSSSKTNRLPVILFILSIFIYLAIRLVNLDQFPIYFFSDEAIQTVRAADFLRDGFRSETQEFFPTYFKNSYQYNLGPSVYIQILPTILFGKHIWVTRATSVFFTLFAAFSVGASIQEISKRKVGWLAILLFSLMPAWFLHSRTAFETVLACSFYSAFWYCYLLYRQKNRRYIFPAAIFAALAFYSYSPAQVVVSFTILAFILNDFKYHLASRKFMLIGFLLGIALSLPYFRFLYNHPGEIRAHMQLVEANLVANLPFWQKATSYLTEYLRGFNPVYWLLPNDMDLPRHLMKGYAHLWQPASLFILIGLIICLRKIKSSPHRMLIIAVLAAPSGAALAQIGITRALFIVFPASVLAALGCLASFEWLRRQIKLPLISARFREVFLPGLVFLGLVIANLAMLVDCLTHAPTWYTDYGLYGMQYGASQIFGEIKQDLERDPHAKIVLTPGWTNGTDILARFFFPDPLPFTLASVDTYIQNYSPLDPSTTFILLSNELEDVRKSKKFTDIREIKNLPYPNGEPGFFFIQMAYVDQVEEIFAKEKFARRELIGADIVLQDGSIAGVHYSPMDMGTINDILDGNPLTIARSWESNPFRFVFDFQETRTIRQVMLIVGGEPTHIEIELWTDMNTAPEPIMMDLEETPDPRQVNLDVNLPQPVIKAEIRVYNENESEPAHVHVWEIRFLPDQ